MRAGRATKYTLRKERHRRSDQQARSSSAYFLRLSFFGLCEDVFERLIPRGDSASDLVAIQLLENIAAQTQPGTILIVSVHQPFPDAYRQAVFCLAIPANLRNLHGAIVIRMEQGAAEENSKRDLAARQAMKILGGGHGKIEGARQGYDHRCLLLESRHD